MPSQRDPVRVNHIPLVVATSVDHRDGRALASHGLPRGTAHATQTWQIVGIQIVAVSALYHSVVLNRVSLVFLVVPFFPLREPDLQIFTQ
jgi:hypothetical protein